MSLRSAAGVVAETAPRVNLEQVISEALAQHVGAMTRDPIAGRVDGNPPFTSEWEVDDDRSIELMGHVSMLKTPPRWRVRAWSQPVTSLGDPHGTRRSLLHRTHPHRDH
jgi:hypothetical protein